MLNLYTAPQATKNDDTSTHEQWFNAYVQEYLKDMTIPDAAAFNAAIYLKREHSFKVLNHSKALCVFENIADSTVQRAIILTGLYHDVARFPQYEQWQTFSDARSVDHALLGAKILNYLQPFANEPAGIHKLVVASVAMHNRLLLPEKLSDDVLLVANAIRDTDKLDIFRIMGVLLQTAEGEEDAENQLKDSSFLHLPEKHDKWSQPIIEAFFAKKMARYSDLRFRNDFRILLLTWCEYLSFEYSRKVLRESGLVQTILTTLPVNATMNKVREQMQSFI